MTAANGLCSLIALPAFTSIAIEVSLKLAPAMVGTNVKIFEFGVTGAPPGAYLTESGNFVDASDNANLIATSGSVSTTTLTVVRFEWDGFGLRLFRDGTQYSLPTPPAALTAAVSGEYALISANPGGAGNTYCFLDYVDISGSGPGGTPAAFWTEFVGSHEVP